LFFFLFRTYRVEMEKAEHFGRQICRIFVSDEAEAEVGCFFSHCFVLSASTLAHPPSFPHFSLLLPVLLLFLSIRSTSIR
jgi:hypothetical protein